MKLTISLSLVVCFVHSLGYIQVALGTGSRLSCSEPAEEGQAYQMVYTSVKSSFSSNSAWKVYRGGLDSDSEPVRALTCGTTCSNGYSPEVLSGSVATVNAKREITMNIPTVTRQMETMWEWHIRGAEIEFCYPNIYAFSEDPTCEDPYVVQSSETSNSVPKIRFKCSIAQTYPVPSCNATYYRVEQSDTPVSATIVEEEVYGYQGSEVYFIKYCIAEVPVLDEDPGTFNVSMTFTPELEGLGHRNKTVESGSYTLEISTPTITGPYLNEDNTLLVLDVAMSSHYPQIQCQFLEQKNTDPSASVGATSPGDVISYSSTVCDIITGLCDTKCSLHRNVSSLDPGNYSYVAKVVPVLTSASLNYTDFTVPDSFTIVLPIVRLGRCPYDSNGNTTDLETKLPLRCQCLASDLGKPPGRISWYDSTNKKVVEGEEGAEDVILTYTFTENGMVFKCKGLSSIGYGNEVTVTPSYSTGPDNVTVFPSSIPPFSLCPDDPTAEVSVSCDVHHVSVVGVPTAQITGLPGGPYDPVSTTTLQEGVATRFTFQFRPTTQGTHTATCTTYDPVDPALSVATNFQLDVHVPSNVDPIIVSNKGSKRDSVLTVTDGQTVQIDCYSPGGIPGTQSTVLECLGLQNISSDAESSRSIQITRASHQGICECTGIPTGGCQSKKSEISINVLYQAEIVFFIAQGSSSQLVTPKDTSVAFECKADGNPRPKISVKRQRTNEILAADREVEETEFRLFFRSTKVMAGCSDTDIYVCSTDNGVEESSMNSIQVFVSCEPELETPTQEERTINVEEGKDISLEYSIVSHPPPSQYTLTRVLDSTRTTVSFSEYQVTTSSENSPFSQVTIIMDSVSMGDSGQYQLTVGNGIGDPKVLTLTIIVASGKSSSSAISDQKVGAISGGVIGAIALVLVAFLLMHRLRQQQMKNIEPEERPARNDFASVYGGRSVGTGMQHLNLAYQHDIYPNNIYTASQIDF